MVVFSHGFGVKRDDRGLFTDLAERLKKDRLVVLFDYDKVDGYGNTSTKSLGEQAEKLREVIEYTRGQFKPEVVDVVAHSLGCVVVGLVSPNDINKAVLIAGPITPFGQKMKDYFSRRKDTTINEEGISTISRSDGTLTLVPSEYWEEASKINPGELYLNLAKKTAAYFVRAKQDQVVSEDDYSEIKISKAINYIELDGDHDFTGSFRKPWLKKMVKILM